MINKQGNWLCCGSFVSIIGKYHKQLQRAISKEYIDKSVPLHLPNIKSMLVAMIKGYTQEGLVCTDCESVRYLFSCSR